MIRADPARFAEKSDKKILCVLLTSIYLAVYCSVKSTFHKMNEFSDCMLPDSVPMHRCR